MEYRSQRSQVRLQLHEGKHDTAKEAPVNGV
jgi:hypothetical protein